ncbi:MAG: hypothetical protein ABIN45_04130 [Gammaproteobacteria bacterium]
MILKSHSAAVASVLVLGLFASTPAIALNYFDLSVYGYKTLKKGERLVENRTAYTYDGTDASAPENNDDLLRSTFEFAYGITDKTEVAAYLDFSHPDNGSWRHVEDRLRVRTSLFEKGQLPVDLGLYGEFEFPRHEDNNAELELRGIIEKDIGKWKLLFNPKFSKVVSGIDTGKPWQLGYAASAIYELNDTWHPRLDLFGDFGPINNFDDKDKQVHLISPAVDIELDKGFSLGLGVAFGVTDNSESLIRTKLEWEF